MTRTPKSALTGGTSSLRQQRVGEEIRHALANILLRGELRDPVLSAASVTISEVSVSPDLKNATVYVMPLGGKSISEVLAALGRAAVFLRRQLARVVRLRHIPQLRFRTDCSFDSADRIEQIFRRPEVARDLTDPASPALEDGDELPPQ